MITVFDALQKMHPNCAFKVDKYDNITWIDEISNKPSEEQIQAKIAELTAAEPLRLLRQQRNQLLAQTDWMANSDVTMSEEWRIYRQALRDLPNTQTPSLDGNGQLTNITWPEKPQ
jgi:hypothetical protein